MSRQAAAPDGPTPETPEKKKARVEGIRKLIQQASSPNRHEAEAAAWRACALIRKHGLDVVDPDLIDVLHKENHTLRAQLASAKAGALDDDDGPAFAPFTSSPFSSSFSTQQRATATHFTTPPRAPRAAAPPPAAQPATAMPGPIIMASQFVSKCKQCRGRLEVGDMILWWKQVGTWCDVSCYDDWLLANPAVKGAPPKPSKAAGGGGGAAGQTWPGFNP